MRSRNEFPAKVRVAAYERCGGRCEECTAPLAVGKFEYDHRITDAMGGGNTLKNCQVLCTNCHAIKTNKQDVPQIAKAKRRQHKHIGAKTKSRNVIAGSKASGWKKKLDGTVVRRE